MERIGGGFELLKPELVGLRPQLVASTSTPYAPKVLKKIRVMRRGALRR